MGPRWRARDDFHRPLSPYRLPDCATRGGTGAAWFAGAVADGHADGSLRRTPRVHGAPRLLLSRRLRRAADRQLRLAPRRGVPRRHGRVVLRSGRGLRLSLDPGGSPGHRPRRLRLGDDGSVACCLCRTGRRGPLWLGSGLSRHGRAAPGLGGGVLPVGAESPAAWPSRYRRRDDCGPAACAYCLGPRRLLLPDLRRFRRVLDLPADAAARAVRPRSGRRWTPRRRIRRPRDAHAARRRMAGRPDRRRPGTLVGLRRCGAVLAAPDVAIHGAVHGRRPGMRDADGARQRRRLQAGAGALPERHRHRDRPRRRPWRTRRVLPAAAPRRLSAINWARSGPASSCCPGRRC